MIPFLSHHSLLKETTPTHLLRTFYLVDLFLEQQLPLGYRMVCPHLVQLSFQAPLLLLFLLPAS